MKKAFLPMFFVFVVAQLAAQTLQNGMVREQNSKRTPIPDVQVNFTDAVPTTSDTSGNFRLAFQSKKAGDLIFFKKSTNTVMKS